MMNYEQALQYLNSIPPFIPREMAPGEEPFNLEKITLLLHYLGNPQKSLRFVHVTGSNGKGSTCAFLTEILTCAGYRTGLYTSPAIKRMNERIRIGNEQISDDSFSLFIERVQAISLKMEKDGEGFPSEFEQMTAAALLYFLDQRCDLVIMEVGLGGRLDATNVIPAPLLAVFTPISKEHTEVLGNTLTEIAAEKAGIIKNGSRVLTVPQSDEAYKVIRRVCRERQVPLYRARDPVSRHFDGEVQCFCLAAEGLPHELCFRLKMAASYQPGNAALAVQAAILLRENGFLISEEALMRGVSETEWPGRFEILRRKPWVIVDGSHNPAGVKELRRSLEECFPGKRIRFIAGVLADKNYAEMMQELLPVAECFYTVTVHSPRALKAKELAAYLRKQGAAVTVCRDSSEAVSLSLADAGEDAVICCFGSLYQVGEFEREFEEQLTK